MMNENLTEAAEEQAARRVAACYDAKTIVQSAIKRMDVGPKGSPEFFQMRRVADYLHRQATAAEAELT
jgi:hypothetical protein